MCRDGGKMRHLNMNSDSKLIRKVLQLKERDLPRGARVQLAPDEYIDQYGLVRRDVVQRRKLAAAPPQDFADVVRARSSEANFPVRPKRGGGQQGLVCWGMLVGGERRGGGWWRRKWRVGWRRGVEEDTGSD